MGQLIWPCRLRWDLALQLGAILCGKVETWQECYVLGMKRGHILGVGVMCLAVTAGPAAKKHALALLPVSLRGTRCWKCARNAIKMPFSAEGVQWDPTPKAWGRAGSAFSSEESTACPQPPWSCKRDFWRKSKKYNHITLFVCRGKVAWKAVRGGREILPQVRVTSGVSTEVLIAEGALRAAEPSGTEERAPGFLSQKTTT